MAISRPRTMTTTNESVNVTWPRICAGRPSGMPVTVEDDEQRGAHHDLGRDQGEQGDDVGPAGRPAPPAGQADGQRHPEGHDDHDGDQAEDQAVAHGQQQRGVAPERAPVGPPPADREALPARAAATSVEREGEWRSAPVPATTRTYSQVMPARTRGLFSRLRGLATATTGATRVGPIPLSAGVATTGGGVAARVIRSPPASASEPW